ncbi:bifunctional diaminohydroxyphosphoribosylaminopyrimidine deaminase/5-amino-6-(5-phosphoribosylamino)uracil reductase RibD [Neokomagataea tanensis]|uniref:Riboflavin biosynthesis protein RibD n=1 Tax=Neokomagataea tanensis TaxID=661191 RepID=A0A4Y6VBL3_9PROT|nr:bifunctional diaminohydroxyphosphoribosylaminopyrimidine deaminase/5-amino-6-(5-phosphoribosylamino)uracil reductase RibD [Neokomagataea tanensis]
MRPIFHALIARTADTLGATAPNPSVGCALLDRHGAVLASGTHPKVGAPHAEIMAINDAHQKGVLDRVHTALVTLEPCNHTGRTPPCSEALLNTPAKDIWIGAADPNPKASGGAVRLKTAPGGRNVTFLSEHAELADLAEDCTALIAPFTQRVLHQRPWISVKQACNEAGSMIPPKGQKTFTSASSLTFAHRLRRATDAIITGIGTVLTDDPSFTVRHIPDHSSRGPRIVVVCDRSGGPFGRVPSLWRARMAEAGFTVLVSNDLASVPTLLAERGVNWAMVEAGPGLLKAVSELNLWDDWLTISKTDTIDRIELTTQPGSNPHGLSPLRLLREKTCSPE